LWHPDIPPTPEVKASDGESEPEMIEESDVDEDKSQKINDVSSNNSYPKEELPEEFAEAMVRNS